MGLTGATGATGATGSAGATGATGNAGADGTDGVTNGYGFAVSDITADSDPGAGNIRFNHASFASVTALFISTADAAAGDVTAWLDSLDDSSSPGHKGSLRMVQAADPSHLS